ncbi:hypothetical protein ABW21_db0207344 [Orbilia brochopaga]|nr:hypothetical protein ABW21_db0207344 [Drechslerella brochopaga]
MNNILSAIALLPLLASALVVPPDLRPRHNVDSAVCRAGSVVGHLNFIPEAKLSSVKAWCANQTATISAEPTLNMTRTVTPTAPARTTATFTKTFTRQSSTKTVTFTYTRGRGNRRPFMAARTAAPEPDARAEKRTFNFPFFNNGRNGDSNNQNDDNDGHHHVPSYWQDAASSLIPVFCSCLDTPFQTHTYSGNWTNWHTRTVTADQTTITSDADVTTTVDPSVEATVSRYAFD